MAIKILLGGSPCTYWSIAHPTATRETTKKGNGWTLFQYYVQAKEKFKPNYFLYENNHSIAQEIKDGIKEALGYNLDPLVSSITIDSALVSAQRRKRFYVTNFGKISQPEDRHISFQDIKDTNEKYCRKFKAKRTRSRIKMWNNGQNSTSSRYFAANITHQDKTYALLTKQDRTPNSGLIECEDFFRFLTIHEQEQLQTLPIGYTAMIPDNQRIKCIGNGWTAEVIIHLLNHVLKDIEKNEEIIVLSLFDGIATGRYCLDKMGFTNVTYHAFEIDKYAIKVALKNYPDIIEHGDVKNYIESELIL